MKIAIIGGGASGMTAAWLLNKKHEVHLFEKASILGGNIRTLNRNVKVDNLPENVYTENGVCFFPIALYQNFKKLMDELGVELKKAKPKYAFIQNQENVIDVALNPLMRDELAHFINYAFSLKTIDFIGRSVSFFLKGYSSLTQQYLKNILELTYSMSCKYVANMPAEIGVPLLRTSLACHESYFIKEGVYYYFEKMLETFSGKIFLKSTVDKIFRKNNSIELIFKNGEIKKYDKIIIATTPDQVLKLLADPTYAEIKRFRNWKINRITTFAHSDDSIFLKTKKQQFNFTNFLFDEKNKTTGYYTCMNHAYDLPENNPYYVTYNFKNKIAPEKILHKANHVTPFYDLAAIKYREEIKETNGELNTYYAGAWLYDGIHEGAITSAMEVSRLLGGKIISKDRVKQYASPVY